MGYTRSAALSLVGEPEAVNAADQWLLTRESQDRQLRTWSTSRQRLLAEIDHLHAHVQSPHVDRTARALRREIDALDKRLTA